VSTREHRVRLLLVCTAGLAVVAGALGQAPLPPTQTEASVKQVGDTKIRTHVSLVTVPVSVMDAKREPVLNLSAKDFQITDNGISQQIVHFDLGNAFLSLVILLETSSRVGPLLPDIRKSGIVFSDTVVGPDDEAAVLSFNDSVDTLADFTTDHAIIQNAINELKQGTQGSKLFDAMALGVQVLNDHRQLQRTPDVPDRRRIMVILSEATDAGSEERLARVLRRAQLSNIAIYSVGLSTTLAQLEGSARDPKRRIRPEGTFPQPAMPGTVQTSSTETLRYGYGDLMNLITWTMRNIKDLVRDHPLEIATSGTGGQHIAASNGQHVATSNREFIEKAVDEIGGELHTQYSLTYEPTNNQVGFHVIRVTVSRRDLKVRSRPGYYIAPPDG
jgi:VWFA-related protein